MNGYSNEEYAKMNISARNMSNGLKLVGMLLACIVLGTALVDEAAAAGADCERDVQRVWNPSAGTYQYTDGGCPTVECDDENDVCYDSFNIATIPVPHVCTCGVSGFHLECTKVVTKINGVSTWTGGTAPNCVNTGCQSYCDPIWTPLHQEPQTLTCPCP